MGSSLVVLIGLFVLGLFVVGDAKAQVSTAPRAVDQLQDMPAPKPKSAAAGLAASSVTSTAVSVPSANPLWTIPLSSLTATRERPLFSPSRRPPQSVVVAKAPPPPPPPQAGGTREAANLAGWNHLGGELGTDRLVCEPGRQELVALETRRGS